MPQLGETVTEGTITKWLKQVGDADRGRRRAVRGLHRQGGHRGAVGPRRRAAPDPGARGRDGAHRHAAGRHHRLRPTRSCPRRPAPRERPRPRPAPPPTPACRDRRRARTGSAPVRAPAPAARTDRTGSCRRWCGRCWPSTGCSPATSSGSGRDGRITRSDVLAAAANRRPRRRRPGPGAGRARRRPPPPIAYPPAAQPGRDDDEVVEFTRARRTTAEHMVRSLATSAHTLVVTEVDYHGVDGVRRAAQLSLPAVRGPGRGRRHRRVPARQRLASVTTS